MARLGLAFAALPSLSFLCLLRAAAAFFSASCGATLYQLSTRRPTSDCTACAVAPATLKACWAVECKFIKWKCVSVRDGTQRQLAAWEQQSMDAGRSDSDRCKGHQRANAAIGQSQWEVKAAGKRHQRATAMTLLGHNQSGLKGAAKR